MRKSLSRDEMVTHESEIHWKACISRQNNDRPESLLSCKKTLSLWTISESCPIFLAYNDFLKTSAVFFKKKDPISISSYRYFGVRFQRPFVNMCLPLGWKFTPAVNTLYWLENRKGEQRVFTPRGLTSTLGDKLSPRIFSSALGVRLKTGHRLGSSYSHLNSILWISFGLTSKN
jgi:hypothetical protein